MRTLWLAAGAALSLSTPSYAQTAPPGISFDSVADCFKLPEKLQRSSSNLQHLS